MRPRLIADGQKKGAILYALARRLTSPRTPGQMRVNVRRRAGSLLGAENTTQVSRNPSLQTELALR